VPAWLTPSLYLVGLWAAAWLAALRACRRGPEAPERRLAAFRSASRLTFWVGVLASLFLGLPASALDGAAGPLAAVLLYLAASLLWALPSYVVASRLAGVARAPVRFVLVEVGVRLFPVFPFLLWLILASLLLSLGAGLLYQELLPSLALVAAFLAATLVGTPFLLAALFRRTDPVLNRRTAALARRMGVPFRRVAIVSTWPQGIANAFVYGLGGGVVFLTDRLLELLEPVEVEAVVAHELTHVRRRHTLKLALVSLLLPLLSTLFPAFGLVFLVLLFLALFALLRRFELEADRGAALAMGSGAFLASALAKLALEARRPLPPERVRTRRLFLTHPPPEERIRRLLGR
jgi:Zn-dependent protease with chaperone function